MYLLPTLLERDPKFYENAKKRKQRPDKKKQTFKQYQSRVRKLTNKQDLSTLFGIEKRDFKKYHVDHMVSIWFGYHNNIPAEEIAHISNLQMLPLEDNFAKNTKSFCVIEFCDHLRQAA